MSTLTATPTEGGDPVTVFEQHRAQMIREKTLSSGFLLAAFAVCTGLAIWVSDLTPEKLANGIPRIF
ncbi:MAG: hypothetical protein AAGI03_06780, partial [Pseudomonadota bacterium]